MGRLRALVLAVLAILTLAACRLDVTVDVAINADGTGEVVVVGTADRDVVEQAPGLAGSLSVDDAAAAGWHVEGPTPTDDGGLTVSIRHPFASVEEASSLLRSLGPPFADLTIERTVGNDESTVVLSGSMVLNGGFDGFADPELIGLTGGTPFGDQLAASGATPVESMSVELIVATPGRVDESNGGRRDGAVVWSAPLDGSSEQITMRAVVGPDSGAGWARPLSVIALVLLGLWLAAGVLLLVVVGQARARRRARQGRRPPPRPAAPS